MIALDTNLLVYAHRKDSPFHHEASRVLDELADDGQQWAIPYPCIHEFIAIVTHPNIYKTPTPLNLALETIAALHDSTGLELIGEGEGYIDVLKAVAEPARIHGGAIHDARIAAICIFHGVKELWSADRDFSRYAKLKIRNPLLKK